MHGATDKHHIKIATFLHETEYRVSIVNPYKISSFKNTNLVRNKTDSYDAILIAEYCKMYNTKEWKPNSKVKIALRDLYRTLESYKKESVRQNNHLESFAESEELISIKKETIPHIEK